MMPTPKHSLAQSLPWPLRRGVGLAILVMFFSGSLWAQISPPYLIYGPLAKDIPTLSGFGLLMLAMIMLAAVWQIKRKERYEGSTFLITALVVGALASAASGLQLVSSAIAIDFALVELKNSSGGQAQLYQALNCVWNNTNVAQQIIEINSGITNAGSLPTPANFGECSSSTVCSDQFPKTLLQQNEICKIDLGIGNNGGM